MRLVLTVLVFGLVVACNPHEMREDVEQESIVASFDGGQVTREELRAAGIIPDDLELQEPEILRTIRELAFIEIMLERGRLLPAALAHIIDLQTRQVVADLFLRDELPVIPEPTEQQLGAEYERRNERRTPPQRLVSHIFRRRVSGEDPVVALASARERIIAGEPFEDLVQELSHSQSRHHKGNLGWKSREELPEQLAEIIFSLPLNHPSEPIVTKQGTHLFLVKEARQSNTFSFEELRSTIWQDLQVNQRRRAIDLLVNNLDVDAPEFRAPLATVEQLLASGDMDVVVYRAVDFEVTAAEVAALAAKITKVPPESTRLEQALWLIDRHDRIYRYCQATRLPPGATDAVESLSEELTIQHGLDQALTEMVRTDHNVDLLRFFDDHRREFDRLPQLKVHRLEIPFDVRDNADAVMGRLEELHRRKRVSLAEVRAIAGEHGGIVVDHGWQGFNGLGALHAGPLRPVFEAKTGETGPPMVYGDRLVMLWVEERRESESTSFDESEDRVIAAYLEANGQVLYPELVEKVLKERHFRIIPISVRPTETFPDQP